METVIDNTTVKKYSVYKDSGVEWIEDVPSHWEVKKFKSYQKKQGLCCLVLLCRHSVMA
jgi:hypothetical protein